MRPFTVYDNRSGEILRVGASDPAAFMAQARGDVEAIVMEIGDSMRQYVDVNLQALAPRPCFGVPAEKALGVDEDWTIPGVPAGTQVIVDGGYLGKIDDTGLVLSFPRAGLWHVRIEPPFPWVPAACEVSVT